MVCIGWRGCTGVMGLPTTGTAGACATAGFGVEGGGAGLFAAGAAGAAGAGVVDSEAAGASATGGACCTVVGCGGVG
jgi:hypothetical protein